MKKRYFIFTVIAVFISCNLFAQKIVILHTNDTHSQITPQSSGNNLGGYQRRENYINKVREENKNVILLDAGDFSQGTPYFTLFKGDVEIELMNALKYDAACIGNHEFDNGPDELNRRAKNASFPILSANYDFKDSPLSQTIKPYTIIKRAGKRIGIIGITTNLRGLVSQKHVDGFKYSHPYNIMNKLALELKNKENCDLIILLTHVGFEGGHEQNPSDELLAQNSENIDIIIGGHSHTFIKEKKTVKNKLGKDVVIVTAGSKGEYVGRLDVEFE
jgi:5''-nucleotidase/2'',3''-cyclic phosphodiesterase and related esterases